MDKKPVSAPPTHRPGERPALLLGRAWLPAADGPVVVTVRDDQVVDITSASAPTARDVCELADPAAHAARAPGKPIGTLTELLANSVEADRRPDRPWLLAPIDLQAVKASGVTFVVSLLERVIEEQAKGSPEKSTEIPK